MWIIIVISIVIIPVYLLFAPFFIEIDSDAGLFRIRFHLIASAGLRFSNESIFMKVKIGWWKKEYDLLKENIKTAQKSSLPDSNKATNKKNISLQRIWKMLKGIIRSFRVRKCYIMLDTGDMPLNGILFPWFYLFSRRVNHDVLINFNNENTIKLKIENSIARMLWAYIKS